MAIRYDEKASKRGNQLYCSPDCTTTVRDRRETLREALALIEAERSTARTPAKRRRAREVPPTAEERAQRRKPTVKELNQWERRVRWELDFITPRTEREPDGAVDGVSHDG